MDIGSGPWLVALGVIGLCSQLVVSIIGAFVTSRLNLRAQEGAKALELAKVAALDSASKVIAQAQATHHEVTKVGGVARDTYVVARETHDLLNGQTRELLRTIMVQAERIANDHPNDEPAQNAARAARKKWSEYNL